MSSAEKTYAIRLPRARLLRDRPGALSHAVIWVGLATLLVWKVHYIQQHLAARAGCEHCLYVPVLQHESAVFGVLLLLYVLSCSVGPRALESTLKLSFLAIALIYALDAVIVTRFSTRLFLSDAQEMSGEIRSGYTLVRTALAGAAQRGGVVLAAGLAGVLLGLVALARFVTTSPRWTGRTRLTLLLAAGLLVGFRCVPLSHAYVSSWMYENVFELNRSLGIDQPYPAPFKDALRASFEDPPLCTPGRGLTPNIILLVVEGLSSYQSRYFSGLHDFTPRLDAIAERHTALVNFHANGFRTTGGMISLVTGQFPLPAVGGFRRTASGGTSLEGFSLEATLPKTLERFGYRSSYMTTCDLGFSDLGNWMAAAGFDAVEGSRSSGFEGWPRFHFDAPPDAALYRAALSRLSSSSLGEPFLLVLATTTSHLPWRSPEGAVHTEESVMRYVDRQIGIFYDELERTGFLDSGMLIVTSDHRQMTPVTAEEIRRFGDAAPAMIPMLVVWKEGKLPARLEEPYQQVDLLASLESLAGESSCRSSYHGTFLAPLPQPPRCVLHVEGHDRDRVYARCGAAEALIEMNGPRTRLLRGSLPDERFLIDKINYDRALR